MHPLGRRFTWMLHEPRIIGICWRIILVRYLDFHLAQSRRAIELVEQGPYWAAKNLAMTAGDPESQAESVQSDAVGDDVVKNRLQVIQVVGPSAVLLLEYFGFDNNLQGPYRRSSVDWNEPW